MHGFRQRWVLRDRSRIGLQAPFAPRLGELLGIGCQPFLIDPRAMSEAHVVGIAVVRAIAHATTTAPFRSRGGRPVLVSPERWSHDVAGLPAGAVVSAGSALDATRLALHYALRDLILVGSATVAAEGLPGGAAAPWSWQADTPLSFGALAAVRARLETGLAETRRDWQARGLLSARERPGLVVVTAARDVDRPAWLAAPALHRHPDGRPAETWLLTSEAGARRAAAWVEGSTLRVLGCSPTGAPARVDLAAIPRLLRKRLDARLVGHDGGRATLAAFQAAGALPQLDLTLVGAPTIAETHPGRRATRFFGAGAACRGAPPMAALLAGGGEHTWVATLDLREGAAT